MGRLSTKAKISLIICAVVGIILASILGFMAGKREVAIKNKKSQITKKVLEDDTEKDNKIICDIIANNDQEFVNYLGNIKDKFSASECNSYVVSYNDFKFVADGKASVEYTGYNIKNIELYYKNKKISIDPGYSNSSFGYSLDVQTGLMNDNDNILYTFIMYEAPIASQPISYIISFNQNGEVLLNEENALKYYFVNTEVIKNVEVKEIGVIYGLVPNTYGNDLLNKCSSEYLEGVNSYPEDTIVYSKTLFNYENNKLNIISEEKRTITEDKIEKAC